MIDCSVVDGRMFRMFNCWELSGCRVCGLCSSVVNPRNHVTIVSVRWCGGVLPGTYGDPDNFTRVNGERGDLPPRPW